MKCCRSRRDVQFSVKPRFSSTRGECVPAEIGVFVLAQGGERVEPLELGIDKARMAHDQAALRQAVEEAGEKRGEIGVRPNV